MITKDEAVCRQLLGAISLYASGVDPLAVYALASGPFAILKDISDTRFKRILAEDDQLIQAGRIEDVMRLAANRPPHQQHSLILGRLASGPFVLDINPKLFWTTFRSKFNFLKHADEGRGGETEVLKEGLDGEEAEWLLLLCVLAYEELALPTSPVLGLFRDHCFAQRGFFDQCQNYRFSVGYDKLDPLERLSALRRALLLIQSGVPVAAVG